MYVAAAMVCLWQLSGVGAGVLPPWEALVAVALMASGTYALDRVKLRNEWIDPADRMAQPERYAFIEGHATWVRWAAVACIVAGSAIGIRVSALAPVTGLLAAAGVVIYAPRPRRFGARLKDVAGLKNVYVAGGITGFCGLVAIMAAAHGDSSAARAIVESRWPALACACALTAARVLLDAALCDLDDMESDRAHGTITLPTLVGNELAWTLTGAARIATLGATMACPWCPWPARVAWTLAGAAGMIALRARRPGRIRDFVDLRLVGVAAGATLGLWLGR